MQIAAALFATRQKTAVRFLFHYLPDNSTKPVNCIISLLQTDEIIQFIPDRFSALNNSSFKPQWGFLIIVWRADLTCDLILFHRIRIDMSNSLVRGRKK